MRTEQANDGNAISLKNGASKNIEYHSKWIIDKNQR